MDRFTRSCNGRHVIYRQGANRVVRGADVRVVDNLSSGREEYLNGLVGDGRVEFLRGNLLDQGISRKSVKDMDVVFHLAADHGGRGYVDLHQSACATNLALDGMLFQAAQDADVRKVVYASSGCVDPNFRSEDPDELLYLKEEMAGPPYDAGNMYGWAKLMGELTLQAYTRERGMASVSCRYFTVYGERGKEDHAIIAMIARAMVMPSGPMNRVADNGLAKQLLAWEPEVSFTKGLHRTIDWYFSERDPADVTKRLESSLTER